jgi:hypothetical protein
MLVLPLRGTLAISGACLDASGRASVLNRADADAMTTIAPDYDATNLIIAPPDYRIKLAQAGTRSVKSTQSFRSAVVCDHHSVVVVYRRQRVELSFAAVNNLASPVARSDCIERIHSSNEIPLISLNVLEDSFNNIKYCSIVGVACWRGRVGSPSPLLCQNE